jgi:hypothetical protein
MHLRLLIHTTFTSTAMADAALSRTVTIITHLHAQQGYILLG